MFPKHCVKGTRGAEIIDELSVKENDIIISKTRYSGFYDTNLDKVLKDKKIEEVEVVGVCTSICVMDTVGDLRNRDYPVIVRKDGVADFDEEAHLFSLKRMEKIYGAKVL
jgi:nicotinamidase-related amidase